MQITCIVSIYTYTQSTVILHRHLLVVVQKQKITQADNVL